MNEHELALLREIDSPFFGVYLSADDVNPLAFSRAPLFRPSQYCLFAEIVGDSVVYSIGKRDSSGRYDSDIVYSTSSFEDISDEWAIYQ